MKIDDRDRRILGALSENGRLSFRELGEIASLSANATAERVQRLQDGGVIAKFSVDVSAAAMGLTLQAFVDVKLKDGTTMGAFEKALQRMECVLEATVLTGAFDARLRVACTDPAHLGRLIEELRGAAGIQETNSTVVCRALALGAPTPGARRLRLR